MAKEIKKLRKQIDKIDREIIKLFSRRFDIANVILQKKRELNLPLTDSKREEEIIEKLKKISKNPYIEELLSKIYLPVFNKGKERIIFEENKEIPFKRIGIIGCGLIGGSIAKAIRTKNKKVKIFTLFRKNDRDIKRAKESGYLDKIFKNLSDLLKETELLIIATPIEAIVPFAKRVARENLSKELVVVDVGSIKEPIVNAFEKLNREKIDFLGTHPMAGSEKQGFSFSFPTLFLNHSWIITPHKKNKKENIKKVKNLIKFLGARPIKILAKEHDLKIAYASHLVFLISRCLFAFGEKKKILSFTGSGFKSLTRLAGSNPEMHFQILKNNEKNIKKALKEFLQFLEKLSLSPKNARKFFITTKKNRDRFYKKKDYLL